MRLFKPFSWVLLTGILVAFTSAAVAQSSTRIAGRIVVAKIVGTVTATNLADQTEQALSLNDVVSQNHRVATGANSQVILIFSNGATVNLGSDSVLSIDEFLQDPFDERATVADLKEEPTTSSTRLNLSRGELVGNVKRLRKEQGSSFIVNTPVGAAGIRGTTFRIVFRPDANGVVIFTLSTSDGIVLFEAPASPSVSVETGKEVVVDVQVAIDAGTGTVTVVAPPTVSAPRDIPAASQVTIAASAQQIVEAAKDVILTTTPPPAAPPSTPPPEPPAAQPEATPEPTPAPVTPPAEPPATPPPAPQPPVIPIVPPDVTPGAGAG